MVVHKLCTQAHFIPIKSPQVAAKEVAESFYHEMIKHRGLLRKIVSEQDSPFTSNIWTGFMRWLQTRLNLSTPFQPQTDGHSESAFRTVQEMLRCFVSNVQNDWYNYLPGLEFTYNNHTNAATKHTPLFLAYGEHPFSLADLLISDSSAISNEAVSKCEEGIKKITLLAKASIAKSNNNRAVKYNKNMPNVESDMGNLVLLSTAKLPLKKPFLKTVSQTHWTLYSCRKISFRTFIQTRSPNRTWQIPSTISRFSAKNIL